MDSMALALSGQSCTFFVPPKLGAAGQFIVSICPLDNDRIVASRGSIQVIGCAATGFFDGLVGLQSRGATTRVSMARVHRGRSAEGRA